MSFITVTSAQLIEALRTAKRGTFATILQVTIPVILKRNAKAIGITDVVKVSKVGFQLGGDYEKAILNQLAREGKDASEYKKGESWWKFSKDSNMILAENKKEGSKPNTHIVYNPNSANKPVSKYYVNGKFTSKLPKEIIPSRRKATNQGTDVEILNRTLKMEGIVKIAFGGKTYKVVD